MRQVIFTWVLAFALGLGACPVLPVSSVMAASTSQFDYANKQCELKFGYRFVRVKIEHGRYICQYRDSNATVTKKALKRCADLGASLKQVTKIYIKGNKYIARMI